MPVCNLGPPALDVGQHLTADIHSFALQSRRQQFLVPTSFMAQFGQERADHIPALHDAPRSNTCAGTFSTQKSDWEMKSFRSDC
jgi:hypothetical protein